MCLRDRPYPGPWTADTKDGEAAMLEERITSVCKDLPLLTYFPGSVENDFDKLNRRQEKWHRKSSPISGAGYSFHSINISFSVYPWVWCTNYGCRALQWPNNAPGGIHVEKEPSRLLDAHSVQGPLLRTISFRFSFSYNSLHVVSFQSGRHWG